jgi:hypothetical protein
VLPDFPDAGTDVRELSRSLKALESECSTIVDNLVREFHALTASLAHILRLGSKTAETIEAGTAASIPNDISQLADSVGEFVRNRVETNEDLIEVVRQEQELVQRLLRINSGNRSIAQEIRMLSILTSVEVALIGESGSAFNYLTRELQAASETVQQSASELAELARSRKRAIRETLQKMTSDLPRISQQYHLIKTRLERAVSEANLSVSELTACPTQFRTSLELVAGRISNVVSAIQLQDITRQQSEHVRAALDKIAAQFDADHPCITVCEAALALRVQILQLANVQQTIETWSSQIDECLEAIQTISHTRLERIAPLVLENQTRLLGHLLCVEQIERECENDSADIAEALSGVAGLLQIVGEHTRVDRLTRDRLQLLSFNSIIESRKMGDRANVMREISCNITRIAAQWDHMAEGSENASLEMRCLMDQARSAVESLTAKKDRELRDRRLAIAGALANLQADSRVTAADAAELGTLSSSLGRQIEAACSFSRSLGTLTEGLARSIGQLERLRRSVQVSANNCECNPAPLESEYSQMYTTEIERQILRAALYGEALPTPADAMPETSVELF